MYARLRHGRHDDLPLFSAAHHRHFFLCSNEDAPPPPPAQQNQTSTILLGIGDSAYQVLVGTARQGLVPLRPDDKNHGLEHITLCVRTERMFDGSGIEKPGEGPSAGVPVSTGIAQ